MDQKAYLKERVDDQIAWYDRKSAANQKSFKRSRIIIIICSVLVPLLSGFSDFSFWIKVLIGGMGALVAIFESIMGVYKYQENWIQYRMTSEALNREKIFYLTRSGTYSNKNDQTRFTAFVTNCEKIMAGENSSWQAYIAEDQEA